MTPSRRNLLNFGAATGIAAAATATRAPTFGNPDEPPQGAVNTNGNASSLTIPDHRIRSSQASSRIRSARQLPMSAACRVFGPRSTTHNGASRTAVGRARGHGGGLCYLQDTLRGVNMRLTAGGLRESALASGAEWAFMTAGGCRTADAADEVLWTDGDGAAVTLLISQIASSNQVANSVANRCLKGVVNSLSGHGMNKDVVLHRGINNAATPLVRILVVDDDRAMQQMMVNYFEGENLHAFSAFGAQDAIGLLAES